MVTFKKFYSGKRARSNAERLRRMGIEVCVTEVIPVGKKPHFELQADEADLPKLWEKEEVEAGLGFSDQTPLGLWVVLLILLLIVVLGPTLFYLFFYLYIDYIYPLFA